MTATHPYLLNTVVAIGALHGVDADTRLRAYADPRWREQVLAGLGAAAVPVRWETYQITESDTHGELVGRALDQVARERGCSPVDVLFGTAVDDGLATRFQTVVANGDEGDVRALLTADGVTLGLSDAGAHLGQLCDAPQATDLLGRWVRDRGALTLERAVQLLSGQQADIFGLADRGYLRPGGYADVVAFNPDTIAPGPLRRVADLPGGGDRLTADQPSGIGHVLVNGTPITIDGRSLIGGLQTRPGHIVGTR
jgi:N-acyl-D-aspartate/D-glutamate deacylase